MSNQIKALEIPANLSAHEILENPILNKSTAFTQEERDALGLNGLLPPTVETLEEQVARRVAVLKALPTQLDRYVYLRDLQDTNETLYFAVITSDLYNILPIIYTPTVGEGCQKYSQLYRRPRGLFLTPSQQDQLDDILANPRFDNVKCIVVTDGERILGLGDQGAGGMGIPIGKLAIYTGCGGIAPETTLPIVLDTGTNNAERIADPLYMGWRHERVRGEAYDNFIEAFVQAVMKRWPDVLLQWEDFHKDNASRLLEKYRDRLCTFNDDVQGTASIAVGALMAAINVTGVPLTEQRVAILGGGSAGIGIADLIKNTMVQQGLSEEEARSRFYIVGRHGLVTEQTGNLADFQKPYCQDSQRAVTENWQLDKAGTVSLLDVMRNAKPTVLVGVSGVAGSFTEAIIREMAKHVARPIVFPMSNPTSCVEALPSDIIQWTDGQAIVGTGSPFEPFEYKGKTHYFAQCNNSYVFPGVGLATIAVSARRITDTMFIAASKAVAELSPANADCDSKLLPPLSDMRKVSLHVAIAVAKQARAEGLTENLSDAQIMEQIKATVWEPAYRPYSVAAEQTVEA